MSPPPVTFSEVARTTRSRTDVAGCYGCSAALVLAQLVRQKPHGLAVALVADSAAAQRLEHDLAALSPNTKVRTLPPPAESPYEHVRPERAVSQVRAATLSELAAPNGDLRILIVCAACWTRKVPDQEAVSEKIIELKIGMLIDSGAFTTALDDSGYQRVPLVEDPGTFAVRGDILDIWPALISAPLRVELEFERVKSIALFDPETQRKQQKLALERYLLPPARESVCSLRKPTERAALLRQLCDDVALPSIKTRALIEDVLSDRMFVGHGAYLPALCKLVPLTGYFPKETKFIICDPSALVTTALQQLETLTSDYESQAKNLPAFPPQAHALTSDELDDSLRSFSTIVLHRTATLGAQGSGFRGLADAPLDCPTLGTKDMLVMSEHFLLARQNGSDLSVLAEQLKAWLDAGVSVTLTTRTESQAERVFTLLRHRGLSCKKAQLDPNGKSEHQAIKIAVAPLSQGIISEYENFVFVTEEEIFGKRKQSPAQTRRSKVFDAVSDLRHLNVGDHVVHVEHGIGKYQGLVHQTVGGATIDVLVIEYFGGDRLLLPVYRLNQVQKYSGDQLSKLDRLGGQSFAKTKSRIRKKVRDIADQLLRIYSARHGRERTPLPPPGDDYLAFEASFPYEETPDQAAAIFDVIHDLQKGTVMDRLVCGDVGFGKTEVALRAAFLAAQEGRQVALLCPTTVLADQHVQSFARRLEGTGIEVRALSRFESKRAIESTLTGLKSGQVDIVIGTHRLLSKDVFFKNLGLLVIDEEQRFGVTHKERMKELRAQVDVLTLSATPIPRTLNLAVGGLLDMSVILTPPQERRAIRTLVARFDEQLIAQAINREIARGGQVFYVYNRVEGLVERAARLKQLIPNLKVGIIHGQMSERELENSMHRFVAGDFDVLCATAIIESGLDIPRANTIIIDRADLFGLAQLYQLRGRVGRSSERAYCYLLVPTEEHLSADARKRIETLERYSELGSGFQVATMDMEFRGTGDFLGAEQTGFTSQIGFELFAEMLSQATTELKGETYVPEVDPELSLDVEALLPESYIEDIGVRLSLYKRYASAAFAERIFELDEEVLDRFGPPPLAAQTFSQVMLMKTRLRAIKALGLQATKKTAHLHLRADTTLNPETLVRLATESGTYQLSPNGRFTRRCTAGEEFRNGLEHAERLLNELESN